MKLTCDRKDLLDGLSMAAKVAPSKSAWPIVEHLLLRAHGDELIITAHDPDLMALECRVPAEIEDEGSATAPAKFTRQLVAGFSEGPIGIETVEKRRLSLKSGQSEPVVLGMNPEEYPAPAEPADGTSMMLPQGLLKEMIGQTIIATSQDGARPILQGILVTIAGGALRMVATDAQRLSLRTSEVRALEGDARALIPGRTMAELARILSSDTEKAATVRISASHARFDLGRVSLICRLIEGEFPAYERVIPTERAQRITVGVDDLVSALKRASLFSRDNLNRVVLRMDGEEQLLITSKGEAFGEDSERITATSEGGSIEIHLNAKLLLDMLAVVGSDKVCLDLMDPLKQVAVRPDRGSDYTYIIMPMQPVG